MFLILGEAEELIQLSQLGDGRERVHAVSQSDTPLCVCVCVCVCLSVYKGVWTCVWVCVV